MPLAVSLVRHQLRLHVQLLMTGSSPKHPSPLSNPPVMPYKQAQPRPIPLYDPIQEHVISTPLRSSKSTTISSTPSSPPLSRSHPLLGSYSLSLLHSRMSHAHAPHSITPTPTSGFSLHLGVLGKRRSCPPELRCPPRETIPFSATYYDLEDAGQARQSPWVGTVDLEQHYYDRYTAMSSGPPPRYPGYRVAPVGQLQILVSSPGVPVKVFLVPYDLRKIPPGGRLLARERTYVQSRPTTAQSAPTAPADSPSAPVKEKLRYSFELQFHCVPVDLSHSPTRDGSTTRRTGRAPPSKSPRLDDTDESDRDFYLARSIRVVFTSTPPERDDVIRTERQDELVLPSEEVKDGLLRGRLSFPASPPAFRRTSFGGNSIEREDWNVVRQKWLARQEMEKELLVHQNTPLPVEHRPSTPPVSLLSSHLMTPSSSCTSVPAEEGKALPPLAVAPPRAVSPAGRVSPKQSWASVKMPPVIRYPSNRGMKRRGSHSVEERELSERLRAIDVEEQQ